MPRKDEEEGDIEGEEGSEAIEEGGGVEEEDVWKEFGGREGKEKLNFDVEEEEEEEVEAEAEAEVV